MKVRVLVAVACIGLLSACAPAALTSKTSGGNLSTSFDRMIMFTEPPQANQTAKSISNVLVAGSENYASYIKNEVLSGGGTCSTSGGTAQCRLERSIVQSGCFNGFCDKPRRKSWTMRVSFPDREGPIIPRFKIDMKVQSVQE